MLKRETLRILVPYSKTLFFVDRGRQMGVAAEFGRALEEWISARYKFKTLRFHVTFLPTARDRLLQALNEGRGDAVITNLTITSQRLAVVDFVDPWLKGVKEIVVTGPASPKLGSIEDLNGREIHVRLSSSYADHLATLSDAFLAKGLKLIVIVPIDENLEDEYLIEMVNAGLLPYVVVDDHKATIWTRIFPNAVPRGDHGRPAEIEIIAIPQISLHDPPLANEFAVRGRAHPGAAMSLGGRVATARDE